ncbi:Outer envelope pore protein 16-2 [Hibiscus syriacus]|uniref:Outer envelope pore protein 16-2 n=1 Tax=Hibiscus syriacus TaxID=106335 RepID=A0A6A3BNN6_HIBSY|nr:outer envelope pore protein 16-2, chloroplastic-like [Hibiscus syriacus]KAE8717677.1 Outer envelope pore protein 16-2 [Hibiscus syriacus]
MRSFDKGGFFFDLGHPLLNRVADSFVKAAGIGAVKAVASEGCHRALDGSWSRKTNKNSFEAMVKSTGKESLQWGLAAGLYSGITYGLQEVRGTHDWKNSAVAGALTGMTVAFTCEDGSHEHLLQCAITGAAISTAANLLKGIV